MTMLAEVRLCRMCHIDDEVAELINYSTRHYIHPSCVADNWWLQRIILLEDGPLERVRASASESGFTQLVGGIDAEIISRAFRISPIC